MASITEKRLCLHRCIEEHQKENNILKSQLDDIQHLANIGTVSYMIAHEINNLLTPIKSYASFALDNPDDKKIIEKALRKTVGNCQRASDIMESMLALANGGKQEKEYANLLVLVEEIFSCLCRDFSKDGITVVINVPEDLKVWGIPIQVQQVLMNLILNARQAMLGCGGTLKIEASELQEIIEIKISDTGDGINPDIIENIFDSFYTTRENKKNEYSGAGLGLAFCKRVVEGHAGQISAESEPDSGSVFKIILPKPDTGNS